MPEPSRPPDGVPRPSHPARRPWVLGLAGAGLFLAGGVLSAILLLSLFLYRLPARSSDPQAGQVCQATISPHPALSPQPTPSPLPAATLPPVGPAVGQRAPTFSLPDLEGAEHSLADYRGQTVLVHFWATWCPPCRQEWPQWLIFSRDTASQAVVVLAVNVEEPLELVRDFVGDEAPPFPILLDRDGSVNDRYRVTSLPITFLVDAEGIVRQVVPGNMDAAALKRLIER